MKICIIFLSTSNEDLLLSSNMFMAISHIILDFASSANQVNLCAKCSNQRIEADGLVSGSFDKDFH